MTADDSESVDDEMDWRLFAFGVGQLVLALLGPIVFRLGLWATAGWFVAVMVGGAALYHLAAAVFGKVTAA